jgi:hypothetical protein
MKTVLKGLLLAGVVLALTGCGVSGRWTMQSVKPEGMEKEFSLKCMCLMDDGTFQACAKEGTEMKMLKGTYKYDSNAHTLTFTSPDGKARTYNAQVQCPGGEMKVWGAEKGKEWTAMMKREGACSKDCCADGKCCGKKCDMSKCPAKTDTKKEEPKNTDVKKSEPRKEEPKKADQPKKDEPKPKDTTK